MTLLDKLRYRLAAINDDFYENEELIDYLNKSKLSIFSNLVQVEKAKAPFGSLRALDKLRKESSVTPSSYVLIDGRYYKSNAVLNINNLDTILYAERLNSDSIKVPARELHVGSLFLLERGNVIPSLYENYYTIVNYPTESVYATGTVEFEDDGANIESSPRIDLTFTILGTSTTISFYPTADTNFPEDVVTSFVSLINSSSVPFTASVDETDSTGSTLHLVADNDGSIYNNVLSYAMTGINDLVVNISNTTNGVSYSENVKLNMYTDEDAGSVTIYYLQKPTTITEKTTTIDDLPDRLENAIIMGSVLLALQKYPTDTQQKSDIFTQLYNQDLQTNTY